MQVWTEDGFVSSDDDVASAQRLGKIFVVLLVLKAQKRCHLVVLEKSD